MDNERVTEKSLNKIVRSHGFVDGIKSYCLREEWDNPGNMDSDQIILNPSHACCPNCREFNICPDPQVISMRQA